MPKINVDIPNVASIVITGPCGCGKSVIMDRIEKMIKQEFGALVVSKDLEIERNGNDLTNLESWEKERIGKTIWTISEQ